MNTISSSLTSSSVKDLQTQDAGNLLSQLEQRVNQTLNQKGGAAGGGAQTADKINPQDVANFMSQLSNQPVAGMNHSVLI